MSRPITLEDIDAIRLNAASGRVEIKTKDRTVKFAPPTEQMAIANELERLARPRIKPSRVVLDKGF